jgi:hypothetical protein
MVDLSVGRASVPHRVAAVVDERDGLLAAMPGYTPSARAPVTKVMSLFPRNTASALPTHQGVISARGRNRCSRSTSSVVLPGRICVLRGGAVQLSVRAASNG